MSLAMPRGGGVPEGNRIATLNVRLPLGAAPPPLPPPGAAAAGGGDGSGGSARERRALDGGGAKRGPAPTAAAAARGGGGGACALVEAMRFQTGWLKRSCAPALSFAFGRALVPWLLRRGRQGQAALVRTYVQLATKPSLVMTNVAGPTAVLELALSPTARAPRSQQRGGWARAADGCGGGGGEGARAEQGGAPRPRAAGGSRRVEAPGADPAAAAATVPVCSAEYYGIGHCGLYLGVLSYAGLVRCFVVADPQAEPRAEAVAALWASSAAQLCAELEAEARAAEAEAEAAEAALAARRGTAERALGLSAWAAWARAAGWPACVAALGACALALMLPCAHAFLGQLGALPAPSAGAAAMAVAASGGHGAA